MRGLKERSVREGKPNGIPNGQPEGNVVESRTRKPQVAKAEEECVTSKYEDQADAADRNNRSLTSKAKKFAGDEWGQLEDSCPHCVFIVLRITAIKKPPQFEAVSFFTGITSNYFSCNLI